MMSAIKKCCMAGDKNMKQKVCLDDEIKVRINTFYQTQDQCVCFFRQLALYLNDLFPKCITYGRKIDDSNFELGLRFNNVNEVKRACMLMEKDNLGKRVANIDVYYSGTKVSREDPTMSYFVSNF